MKKITEFKPSMQFWQEWTRGEFEQHFSISKSDKGIFPHLFIKIVPLAFSIFSCKDFFSDCDGYSLTLGIGITIINFRFDFYLDITLVDKKTLAKACHE